MSVETSATSTTATTSGEAIAAPAPASAQELGGFAVAVDAMPVTETGPEVIPDVDQSLLMHETDGPTIDAQMEAGITREGVLGFLNNFEHHLPGGWDDRNLARYPELLDKSKFDDDPFEDDDEDLAFLREPRPTATEQVLHSARYLTATHRSMQEDIRQVVEELESFDPATLEVLRENFEQKRDASPSHIADDEREQYLTYALPVYKGLRQLGYSHYDLWC